MILKGLEPVKIFLVTILLLNNVESHRNQNIKSRRESPKYKRDKREVINKEIEDYLTRFGYLPQSDLETGALRTMQQLRDAIRNLQGFAGLNMTGNIDNETRKLIHKRRCGVQDVSLGFRNKRSVSNLRVKRYNLQGQRWSHTNLTWSIRGIPQSVRLARDVVRRELTYALDVWARHTLLTFTETYEDEKADIQVTFHSRYHGDGYPFDGPGSVLAHAFFPGLGRGGDVHFDEEESWSDRREISRQATSLFAVAVHEFGHSLGLSHSTEKTSLMFPWYSSIPQHYSLPGDDLEAIQYLYGEKLVTTPRHRQPSTTSSPRAVTSGTKRPERPTGQHPHHIPDKCDTNFDAVAVLRGEMWVFKDRYFWRINKDGGSREDPMDLRSFWYGLPSNVDHVDAVYEKSDHDIVFFVGRNYYVLASNSYLKYGPLPITTLGLPESLERLDGAMRWGYNDKTYFFSGTMYWRFDEEEQYVELDYPRDIERIWRGIPYKIDAVFQWQDHKTYFFKEKYFWEFNDQRMEVSRDSPKLIGELWLQCPKEIQDPFKKAKTSDGQISQTYTKKSILFSIIFTLSVTRL